MIDIEKLKNKGALEIFKAQGYHILIDIDDYLTYSSKIIEESDNFTSLEIIFNFLTDFRSKFKSNKITSLYNHIYDDLG
jgi:hypothetical protein